MQEVTELGSFKEYNKTFDNILVGLDLKVGFHWQKLAVATFRHSRNPIGKVKPTAIGQPREKSVKRIFGGFRAKGARQTETEKNAGNRNFDAGVRKHQSDSRAEQQHRHCTWAAHRGLRHAPAAAASGRRKQHGEHESNRWQHARPGGRPRAPRKERGRVCLGGVNPP